jgi:hypothetical protein
VHYKYLQAKQQVFIEKQESKMQPLITPPVSLHAHLDGKRCCGRPLSEKCSPEEEQANTDARTGEKECCRNKEDCKE